MNVKLLILFIVCALCACEKEEDTPCMGCMINTDPKEFQFNFNGILYANCEGSPASFRTMEFYAAGNNNPIGVTHSDSSGNFTFTYTLTLQWPYHIGAQFTNLFVLKVIEDSVEYVLPVLPNLNNLQLYLNDSIDVNIYVDNENGQLLPTDTLIYYFEPSKLSNGISTIKYKTGGPVGNHELIRNVKSKWKIIRIDNAGNPVLNIYWEVNKSTGTHVSAQYTSKSSKSLCIMKTDSVSIKLN